MKLPAIPLPEPVFMITVHGPARGRRAVVEATRLVLWGIPSGAVDCVLATAGHGRHSTWLTFAAACITLAIAVLVVNVRGGSGEGAS